MRLARRLFEKAGCFSPGGDFEAQAVGVEEIDRAHEFMIDQRRRLDAMRGEPLAHRFYILDRIGLDREMLHPVGRVRRRRGHFVTAKIEKGDVGAVPHFKEKMDIGGLFAGARHALGHHAIDQRQAENILVEMPRFLGIAARIGEMIQAIQRTRVGHHMLLFTHSIAEADGTHCPPAGRTTPSIRRHSRRAASSCRGSGAAPPIRHGHATPASLGI